MNKSQEQLETFSSEEEDIIENIDSIVEQISEIVVAGTDWTTATILDQLTKENIKLTPRFQRRDAWNIARKSRFVESLILGFPIPQIVLASSKKGRGKYIVLDGKQRLLTILQFYSKSNTKNNAFRLKGLELRSDLNGMSYQDLVSSLFHSSDLDALDNQPIRTTLIRSWGNEDILHKIFLRLNVENTPLSPQELRQALHPGDFTNYVDDISIKSAALKKLFKSSEPDYRMRDVEILVRFIAFNRFINSYKGNLKRFLDQTCKILNDRWGNDRADIELDIKNFEDAVEAGFKIFGQNFSKVWIDNEKKYQRVINRAVLDVMLFYFSDQKIRESSLSNPHNVRAAFEEMCASEHQFIRSVERTSKNMTETETRFSLWGKYLSEALDLEMNFPRFDESKENLVFNGLWL